MRLEVHVHLDDAPLVRAVVRALADSERSSETRNFLRERFADHAGDNLKALLAAAPLEGVELRRRRDVPRDVDL